MNIKKKTIYTIVVVLTVLAVDMLFLHIIFPAKRERLLKEMNQQVTTSLEEHPPSVGKKLEKVFAGPNNSLTDFKTAAQNCLGSSWSSFQTFPEELRKVFKVQSEIVDIENYHLKLPSGEERRIHVVGDGHTNKTVRLFGLDEEGLPTPIPLPEDLRSQTPDEMIRNLKDQGQVFFHQSKQRWLLGNGTTLLVTFENDQTYEFQLFGPDKTLSCFKESCQCQ